MQPDATCKHLLSHAFMVEELLRWLVADLRGMHALVDALCLTPIGSGRTI